MLKIAEYNQITGEKIDLKELEKFGFEEEENNYFYYGFTRPDCNSEIRMYVDKKDRTIYLKECLSFATPKGKIKQFTNVEKATIYFKAMGNGSTFDKIVVFEEDKLPKSTNSEEKNFEHFKNQLQIYDEMAKYLERELKDETKSGV